MTATRPLIAIDGELSIDKAPAVHLPVRYAEAVHRAGGLPLVLPPLGGPRDPSFLEELIGSIDGLVLAGGDDFDTAALGLGPTHPSAKPVPARKQAFDLELARAALAADVPTLGICYGMQLLALAEGGDLHQHLPTDRPEGREHGGGVRHDVSLARGSKLGDLLGVSDLSVVSRHHQALAATGPEWTVCGVDDEGLIEAIERRDHPFALGVQWHPEIDVVPDEPGERQESRATGDIHLRLFEGLVHAAATRSRRTQRSTLTAS